jgi:hypothetical protein
VVTNVLVLTTCNENVCLGYYYLNRLTKSCTLWGHKDDHCSVTSPV